MGHISIAWFMKGIVRYWLYSAEESLFSIITLPDGWRLYMHFFAIVLFDLIWLMGMLQDMWRGKRGYGRALWWVTALGVPSRLVCDEHWRISSLVAVHLLLQPEVRIILKSFRKKDENEVKWVCMLKWLSFPFLYFSYLAWCFSTEPHEVKQWVVPSKCIWVCLHQCR